MHVLIIPSWYKAPDRPVVGSFFEEQARMLRAQGLKVGIFYPLVLPFVARWRKNLDIPQPTDVMDNGIPTYHNFQYTVLPKDRYLTDWNLCRSSRPVLQRYFDAEGVPDIIHSHALVHAGIVARSLSRELGIPYVHTEHLTSLVHGAYENDSYAGFWARRVFRDARRCAVVGSKFREDLAGRFGLGEELFEVIPNVVGPRFLSAPAAAPPPGGPFTFFTNSFINERKNHRLLLDAFSLVRESTPDARLRIGGYGYSDLQQRLEGYAREKGLGSSVTFLGELAREQVVEELERCHAFVLASQYESFGVVLIEALALGRPVVSTDSGGPRDIIEPGDGILVAEHSPGPLAEAMLGLVSGYSRYDGGEIRTRCERRFSEPVIAERIMRMYRQALAG